MNQSKVSIFNQDTHAVLVHSAFYTPTVVVVDSDEFNKLHNTGKYYEQMRGNEKACKDEAASILSDVATAFCAE